MNLDLLGRPYVFIVALLIVAWLTAGAMAVRSVSRIWLRHWTERRLRGSAAAVTYLERPHRLLIGASTGVALTLVMAGVLLGLKHSGPQLVADVALFVALVVLVGQVFARAVARQWPTYLVPVVVPVLRGVELLVAPIVGLGRRAAAPFERRRGRASVDVEREALQDLLREGELEGVGEREEIAIISGVVEFGAKRVRDVMTPASDIFALDDTLDARTLALRIAQSNYSRVPIYHGSLDDVRGMVHAFDVLKAGAETFPPLRPVANATADAPCNELLFRMLRERQHLAIVRDANDATMGLVSLEDLLEELVGDIRDEHDEPEAGRGSGGARGSA
ncbi:MAG TPA: CNNM domain-containing protein [Gemmatimonadaceae bacterium]|jgi:putative hemolysin|nr:CNNM domain-containing protein [Gemmatimonadaceae bacterium]